MAKFKVCVQRFVEETAEIEVEADDVDAAIEEAEDLARGQDDSVTWGEGDEIMGERAYFVRNEDGDQVWEDGGAV